MPRVTGQAAPFEGSAVPRHTNDYGLSRPPRRHECLAQSAFGCQNGSGGVTRFPTDTRVRQAREPGSRIARPTSPQPARTHADDSRRLGSRTGLCCLRSDLTSGISQQTSRPAPPAEVSHIDGDGLSGRCRQALLTRSAQLEHCATVSRSSRRTSISSDATRGNISLWRNDHVYVLCRGDNCWISGGEREMAAVAAGGPPKGSEPGIRPGPRQAHPT